MKNASEIKHSLNAVKQTRQITNAMYLLSVSEMKRYISSVNYTVEYMKQLRQLKRDLLSYSHGMTNPFKSSFSSSGRKCFVIISGEKGMCGSYNQEIASLAYEKIKETENPHIIIKGGIAKNILSSKGIEADEVWEYPGNSPSMDYAASLAEKLTALYLSDEIDEVDIIYTKYLSQTKQRATCYRLLPLAEEGYDEKLEPSDDPCGMEFCHNADEVFLNLSRHFIKGLLYSAMYQSFICEHVSRMNAMHAATGNADEMIEDLTRKYNGLRQLAITNEITEITAAARNTAGADSEEEDMFND